MAGRNAAETEEAALTNIAVRRMSQLHKMLEDYELILPHQKQWQRSRIIRHVLDIYYLGQTRQATLMTNAFRLQTEPEDVLMAEVPRILTQDPRRQ